ELRKMKNFKSTTIKSIIGSCKLIIEVPHQRPASIYDTNMRLTDYISESSSQRLRDSLQDLNHSNIINNLGELKEVVDYGCDRHQGARKYSIIKNWASENLTGSQYLWLMGERKSNND
ncbi:MAG TPA: hypothetical protein VEA37_11160, partial [Flavobacterium sp.]|nr:hypothetical protein [Flavobacterium sp.]